MSKRISILIVSVLLFGVVQAQVIQLRKPAKGDIWPGFTIQRIQWTSTNIDNIKLECSLDSGRTWSTIISSYPASAEYYDWQVPNKVSDSCFIRVIDVANAGTLSTNYPANPFIIPKPGITVDAIPAIVFGQSVLPIPWTHSGIKKVNVYLSYSGKTQFQKIADTISANNGFFIWQVKDTSVSNCYIRIEDASNTALSDTSDIAFSIQPLPKSTPFKFRGGKYDGHAMNSNLPRVLRVITPNLKDSLVGSTVYTIRWVSRNVDQVKIDYTTDNGNTWVTIQPSIPASSGLFDWKVPNTPTSFGRIRVVDLADTSFKDASDSLFVIRKKELKLLLPTTTDKLYKGSVWPISWMSIGVSRVRLRSLPSRLIADSVLATNENFNWVASSLPDSFRIVIQDLEDSLLTDTTGFLRALNLPVANNSKYRGGAYDGHASSSNSKSRLTITSPNKKQVYSAGAIIPLQWSVQNIDKLSLLLSTDSMKTWVLREASLIANTGTYSLRLPNTTANFCFIKLVNTNDTTVFDISDSSFSIIPKQLKNTTDSLGWSIGYPKLISWESVGVDSLQIAYRISERGSWNVLHRSYAANAEAYYWIIPASFDSLWMRLQDVNDTSLNQITTYHKRIQNNFISSSTNKYKGGKFDGHSFRSNINRIIIRKPDANEVVVSGTYYTVNWATINVTDSVSLQYSIDSGKIWIPITKVPAGNGTYSWLVPVTLPSGGTIGGSTNGVGMIESGIINSTNCLLRAVDQANANEIVGISTKTFTIKAAGASKLTNTILFTKPSDMVWPGGTDQVLKASSTSGRNLKIYIVSGSSAQLRNDTLIAVKPGKVTVAAFSLGDTLYSSSDTIRYTICVNPSKPAVTVKDNKLRFCKGDSTFISGPAGFSYKWNLGDTIQTLFVKSTRNLTLQVSTEGCMSVPSDTVKFSSDTVANPIVSDTSICLGSNFSGLKATASIGHTLKWYGTNQTGGTASTTAPVPVASSTGSFNYYVSQTNSIGCESDRSKIVFTVNALPDKPTVTWKDTILSIPSTYTSYQWLLNNAVVTGANSFNLRPLNSGNYRVIVKNAAGCSDTSAVYTLAVTAISSPMLEGKRINLYPNPTSGSSILDLGQKPRQPVLIKLITMNGVLLNKWFVSERKSEIDLTFAPQGEYILELISNSNKTVIRVVKVD